MTEQPSHPSRLLRLFAGFARWSLWLLLALWLLVVVAWGLLHGLIVPRIGDFRQQVQTQVETALGVPVRIGQLSARSEGLIPTIELGDVQLLDPAGREALVLPKVVAAISPRSMFRLGFEQLYIEGPRLDIRREADGRIYIAGVLLQGAGGGDSSAAADWLFSQGEVAIMGGSIRWTDAQRGAPPLELSDVNLVMRNGAWRHRVRLDATPPQGWGERFSVRGVFREQLLSVHSGNWKAWSGQLFADLPHGDISRLNQYADLGSLRVSEGQGAVRAWVDVRRGLPVGGVADVHLTELRATLGSKLQPLAMQSVTGRIGGQQYDHGFELSTRNLAFETADGLNWPGANLYVGMSGMGSDNLAAQQGELRVDTLNLEVLAQILERLPLDEEVHEQLRHVAPRGMARNLQLNWHGPFNELRQYQASGTLEHLSVGLMDAGPRSAAQDHMPGVQGANVRFNLTQAGGNAELALDNGRVYLPGVFEDPRVPMQRLNATVNWQIDGERIAVDTQNLRFSNPDITGEARIAWHTSDPRKSSSESRFPGVLDLTGSASRADGTKVHRYLPLTIPDHTRHYVRDAVNAGDITQAHFRVKGDLHDFPFLQPAQGEFRIAAQVKNVVYTYVPASIQSPGELPWPALSGLSGELVFERSSMWVNKASGSIAGYPQIKVRSASAQIPDLDHGVVGVDAEARGPLADMLAMVRASHITQLTDHALDKATANGTADLKLQLSLPLDHIDNSRVQGSVRLAGNDVQFSADVPPVSQAVGAVQFSENGFSLMGIQGQALGGDVKLEGGMRMPAPAVAGVPQSALQIRAQGVASAEGLRSAAMLGGLSSLARHAHGSTPYTVLVGMRHGVAELQVQTSLQGMALDLPAPLGKGAQESRAVQYENQLTPASLAAPEGSRPQHDLLSLDVAGVGSVRYQREVGEGEQPSRVQRGVIRLGTGQDAVPAWPESGVVADVALGHLDVGAWQALFTPAASSSSPSPTPASAAHDEAAMSYLPTRITLRADEIEWQGRSARHIQATVLQQKDNWHVNVNADELSGFIEYRPESDSVPAPGLIYARLDRLKLPKAQDDAVDTLLSDAPRNLPALDVVAQNFEIHGRELGRLEVKARNLNTSDGRREWRLSRLNLATPEATFTSSGNWALLGGTGANAERRTVMNFELDIRDSGDLLKRFGMADVVRKGKGRMQGQVAWLGAPLSPHYPSMTGQLNLDMQAGQFLKADPGLAKLLSVLSLQSIPRRLTLDFRDVFSEGFAFDFVRGDVRIDRGVATTNNLQMKGLNAAVLMEGKADLDAETQDLHVVVVPEINAMTASLVATAINPVVGLGSFLAQMFLRGPLMQAATQEFRIDGTWTDPRVERVARKKVATPVADVPAGAASGTQ